MPRDSLLSAISPDDRLLAKVASATTQTAPLLDVLERSSSLPLVPARPLPPPPAPLPPGSFYTPKRLLFAQPDNSSETHSVSLLWLAVEMRLHPASAALLSQMRNTFGSNDSKRADTWHAAMEAMKARLPPGILSSISRSSTEQWIASGIDSGRLQVHAQVMFVFEVDQEEKTVRYVASHPMMSELSHAHVGLRPNPRNPRIVAVEVVAGQDGTDIVALAAPVANTDVQEMEMVQLPGSSLLGYHSDGKLLATWDDIENKVYVIEVSVQDDRLSYTVVEECPRDELCRNAIRDTLLSRHDDDPEFAEVDITHMQFAAAPENAENVSWQQGHRQDDTPGSGDTFRALQCVELLRQGGERVYMLSMEFLYQPLECILCSVAPY